MDARDQTERASPAEVLPPCRRLRIAMNGAGKAAEWH
jgi:hypothetical protein